MGGETGKRLRSWKFAAYAGGKRPEWLETAKVMRAFRRSDDGRVRNAGPQTALFSSGDPVGKIRG